jgi:hypothetical protein
VVQLLDLQPLLLNCRDRSPGQDHGAVACPRLERNKDQADADLLLKRAMDDDAAAVGIDIVPAEPERLADAQGRGAENNPHWVEGVPDSAV